MELPGTSYLYNLTLISVTFAGFAALIAAFRQMVGGRFTKHDAFLIRSALVRSLIVIVCALLPPLLALFEFPAAIIWRVSSFSAAILIALFTLSWQLIIRPMATDRPISKTAHAYHSVQLLTAIFLLIVSLGIFFEPGAGYYAVGVSLFMSDQLDFSSAIARDFISPQSEGREKQVKNEYLLRPNGHRGSPLPCPLPPRRASLHRGFSHKICAGSLRLIPPPGFAPPPPPIALENLFRRATMSQTQGQQRNLFARKVID